MIHLLLLDAVFNLYMSCIICISLTWAYRFYQQGGLLNDRSIRQNLQLRIHSFSQTESVVVMRRVGQGISTLCNQEKDVQQATLQGRHTAQVKSAGCRETNSQSYINTTSHRQSHRILRF